MKDGPERLHGRPPHAGTKGVRQSLKFTKFGKKTKKNCMISREKNVSSNLNLTNPRDMRKVSYANYEACFDLGLCSRSPS